MLEDNAIDADEPIIDRGSCTCIDSACSICCGDGHVDPPEQCDDGNLQGGDGCEADCTLTP